VTGSGYNNVKDSMTAAISRQLSASSAHAISSAAPEESRSETSVFNVNDLIWDDFNCSAAMQVRNPQASASLVRQFVDESNTGRQDDPLACWRGRVQFYRKLVPLAQKSICIVATSVPSEWVFSKTGQLISVRRNRLLAKTVKSDHVSECELH